MRRLSIANETLKCAQETGALVEEFLRDYCASALQGQSGIESVCEGSIADIGLRIRPFLLRISCHQGGIGFDKIIPIASGVEMIQLSTLIIDDILDESPLRNDEPSIFAEQGSKACLCIGSVMSSLGFCLISEGIAQNEDFMNPIAAVQLLSRTHANIYVGQFLDLRFERDVTVTESQYLDMISRTTACFIQAPLVVGAMLWDASPETIEILERAGLSLGMAYQIRDDVIDIIGDPECTGKPVGGDIRRCKMRLPLIEALRELGDSKRRGLLGLLQDAPLSDGALGEATGLITESGAIDYCISKAKEFCNDATNTIGMLPREFAALRNHLCVVAGWISSFEDRK